ncbi:MAG: universal stress protein [Cyanobacteria bacterium P01_F01_bin.53]
MTQRILVALDLLEPDVFETALSLATATHADLLLLHVLSARAFSAPPVPFGSRMDYSVALSQHTWELYQKQWQAFVEESLETLRTYTGRAEVAGVNADFMQSENEPGPGICSMASTWNADMIVMGSHQRRGLSELFLGSVSNYVMHHAPCSVMVVSLGKEENSKAKRSSKSSQKVAAA